MMSNYPPGVSGNEPQIVGRDAVRDCDAEAVPVVPVQWVEEGLTAIRRDMDNLAYRYSATAPSRRELRRNERVVNTIYTAIDDMLRAMNAYDGTGEADGSFSYEVEVFADNGRTVVVCPLCGKELTEEQDGDW